MRKSFIAMLGTVVLAVACTDGRMANPPVSTTSEIDAAADLPLPAAQAVAEPARTPAAPPVAARPRPVAAAPAPAPAPKPAPAPVARPAVPEYREVLVPAGTALALRLTSAVASDSSQVEDVVRATLHESVMVDGQTVLPAGARLVGHVTDAERSGRVRGRARVAFQFTVLAHDGDEYDIRSEAVERIADATKGEDAKKVGIGAGAGAALGALLGGGSGAAKGAAIGAAAGTGAVLATRGEEVRLEPGETVETRLSAPLAFRVRVR